MIGLTNIWGLIPLGLIPIIIILYMLRPKNIPTVYPSLYLWKSAIKELESATKFQKLKSSILMFLQILTIILISLMLSGLFLKGGATSKNIIVVIDCSVSMQSNDIEPNRLEVAKEQASNYIKKLDGETKITLIALTELPEILLKDENSKSTVVEVIKKLQPVDTFSDLELTNQTINAVKVNNESQVVYFGDRKLAGAENYIVQKNNKNVGISNIAYTKYEEQNKIVALVELINDSSEDVQVPVSLYVDEQLLDAKEVEINANEQAKVFFDTIPIETNKIKAQIDKEDILEADNVAYTIVTKKYKKKVALVTDANVFLEKILKINQGIDLYLVEPKDINTLTGYDLYIYDSVLPDELPKDGSILVFNPISDEYYPSKGFTQQPEFYTSGNEITNLIEKPEFSIGVTKVFELPNWAQAIYEVQDGVCAYSGINNNIKTIVFGFDIHNTNLPLSIEFPILMINVLDYLIPNSMLENTSITAGDSIDITIYPDTNYGVVINPLGEEFEIDLSSSNFLFKNTGVTGIYEVKQESENEAIKEQFAVNIPRPEVDRQVNDDNQETTIIDNNRNLYTIIGLVVVLLLLIEWFIYNYRRKIHEIKL